MSAAELARALNGEDAVTVYIKYGKQLPKDLFIYGMMHEFGVSDAKGPIQAKDIPEAKKIYTMAAHMGHGGAHDALERLNRLSREPGAVGGTRRKHRKHHKHHKVIRKQRTQRKQHKQHK